MGKRAAALVGWSVCDWALGRRERGRWLRQTDRQTVFQTEVTDGGEKRWSQIEDERENISGGDFASSRQSGNRRKRQAAWMRREASGLTCKVEKEIHVR